jgi:WD40 repeat protein
MGMRAEESEGHGNGEGLPTAEDASVLERLDGHQAPITVCRFSPGGQHVASGASDGTVRIWAPACTSGAQPASDTRAASFQAGGPILSLDWDR